MDKSEVHIAELLPLLKKGDKAAFNEIFTVYERKLYYFIFSMTKSDYATEDILQDVFVKLWNTRGNLDLSASFDAFIFTVARNLTYNHLRKVANQKALRKELWRNLSCISKETEETILSAEYEEIVNDILLTLPVQKRSIFILSKQQGRSNQEIADLLGISSKTVKNHLWKTLKSMKAQLKPYMTDTIVSLLFSTFVL